jgi:MOSC domain-containing protein YiiM
MTPEKLNLMGLVSDATHSTARLLAVCVSHGGVPKRPIDIGEVLPAGLVGDGHAHAKHNRLDRAISLFDIETLEQLNKEGFALQPGTAGENLTVQGLFVQRLSPGTLLRIGEVILQLEQPRKPCYVLDKIDPRLKEVIVGRCGYMASVVRSGEVRAGMAIDIVHEPQLLLLA